MTEKKIKVVGVYIVKPKEEKAFSLRGKEGKLLAEKGDRVLVEIENKEYSLPKSVVEYI